MPAHPSLRRSCLGLLVLLVTAGLLLAPGVASARGKQRPAKGRTAVAMVQKTRAAAAAATCPDADLEPAPGNLPAVRTAILCLHNQIRAQRGLPLLKENPRLRRAAAGHSADMVTRGYFAHTAPAGSSFVDRILGSRYVGQDDGWVLGENLAWGTGSLATPAGIMRAWMDSPEHRANVLKRAYREVGLGIVTGVPSDRGAGGTYTADFGVRR